MSSAATATVVLSVLNGRSAVGIYIAHVLDSRLSFWLHSSIRKVEINPPSWCYIIRLLVAQGYKQTAKTFKKITREHTAGRHALLPSKATLILFICFPSFFLCPESKVCTTDCSGSFRGMVRTFRACWIRTKCRRYTSCSVSRYMIVRRSVRNFGKEGDTTFRSTFGTHIFVTRLFGKRACEVGTFCKHDATFGTHDSAFGAYLR